MSRKIVSLLVMAKNSGLEGPKTVVKVGWMSWTGNNQNRDSWRHGSGHRREPCVNFFQLLETDHWSIEPNKANFGLRDYL